MRIGQSSHCSLNLISGFLSSFSLSFSSISLNPMFAESFMLWSSSRAMIDRAAYFLFILLLVLLLIILKLSFASFVQIISNIINTYSLGILSLFSLYARYLILVGSLILSLLFYLFLSKLQFYLLLLTFVEAFSIAFQSLTLTNRLSINLLSGSLLVNLLFSRWSFHATFRWTEMLFFLLTIAIFDFELLNSSLQLIIFFLLHYEYNSSS
jgi:hypothetical protein